ncbi:hypothetical protein [Sorangium sp. So ce128]|uniref:hypothetical protein n=1 Tax=Sorangium sp. So ce128 TaxID=3133281 RepID=UPI003F63F3CA
MRMRDVVSALLGGGAIYLAMAACAASERASPAHQAQQNAGGSGQGAEGGANAQQAAGGSGTHGNAGNGGGGGFMDPVPDASAAPVSGSRLKARYRTTDDGAKVYDPSIWFDSERRELCVFLVAADGRERCVPYSGSVRMTSKSNYFADSNCTQPVVISTQKGCAPEYAQELFSSTTACEPAIRWRFFSIGARLDLTSTYVLDSAGACKAQTASTTVDYFALGDEIPPSSFVASTWAVDP